MDKNQTPEPLTPKEKNVLEFLEAYMARHGFSPSYQEIKDHFGFASFNSVQRYLKQLEKKNYLHSPGGNKKRAIQLLHSSTAVQSSVVELNPSSSHYDSMRGPSAVPAESLSLPMLGRVAAGQPIEAFEHDEFVDVPASFVRNPSRSYALRVQGHSMIEEGIHDGDIVLVQEQKQATQGEIVVAVVEGEATVKRFYRHKKSWRPADLQKNWEERVSVNEEEKIELRPANAQMESMWFHPSEVEIRGVIVGLMRRYS